MSIGRYNLKNKRSLIQAQIDANKEAARREAVRRAGNSRDDKLLLARSNMLDFTTYTKPDYSVNWHHSIICSILDRVLLYLIDPTDPRGLNRIMFSAPPRTGKTELVSRRFPAYVFGRLPDTSIIATSYGADLASLINRDVQRIMVSDRYKAVFPDVRLNERNVRTDASGNYLRNNDIFEIVGYGGSYRSAGVGGAIVGLGGKLIIIDDPIKSRAEANSEAYRKALKEWYTATLYSRLADDKSAIVLMHQRWHEDDLAGWLLDRCDPNSPEYDPSADKWILVTFPAVLDSIPDPKREYHYYQSYINYEQRQLNEALWPERFSLEQLERIRSQGIEDWDSIQQQRPRSPKGAKFQRQWFKLCETIVLSDECELIRYWDKAGTSGAGAFSCGVLMLFDPHRHLGVSFIVVDVVRKQVEATGREKLIRQTAILDNARYGRVIIWYEQEPGSGGKESAQNTLVNTLVGFEAYCERATGDKVIRANPFAVQAGANNVGILVGDWNEVYLRELESFPFGRYKDQVDGSSGSFNKLALGWERIEQVEYEEDYEISPI